MRLRHLVITSLLIMWCYTDKILASCNVEFYQNVLLINIDEMSKIIKKSDCNQEQNFTIIETLKKMNPQGILNLDRSSDLSFESIEIYPKKINFLELDSLLKQITPKQFEWRQSKLQKTWVSNVEINTLNLNSEKLNTGDQVFKIYEGLSVSGQLWKKMKIMKATQVLSYLSSSIDSNLIKVEEDWVIDDSNHLDDFEKIKFSKLNRLVKAGEEIKANYLIPAELVSANTPVKVMYQKNSLSLVREARAVRSGTLGEVVELQIQSTHADGAWAPPHKIYAKIIDYNQAVME